jgi:hypothetical protein
MKKRGFHIEHWHMITALLILFDLIAVSASYFWHCGCGLIALSVR